MNEEKRIINKGWNITILIIVIIGLLINLYLIWMSLKSMRGEYGEYQYNLEHLADDDFYIEMRLFRYQMCRLQLVAAIVSFITLFLILFLVKFRNIIFLIYGAFAIGCVVARLIYNDSFRYMNLLSPSFLVLYGVIISMGGMLVGILLKRMWVIWIAFAAMCCTAIYAFFTSIAEYSIYYANFAAMIMLAAFHVRGVKTANRAPRVTQYYNQGFYPTYNMGYNPNMNAGYNPNMNYGYNPNMNAGYNPNMNYGYNPNTNYGYNPNINPGYNPGGNGNVESSGNGGNNAGY